MTLYTQNSIYIHYFGDSLAALLSKNVNIADQIKANYYNANAQNEMQPLREKIYKNQYSTIQKQFKDINEYFEVLDAVGPELETKLSVEIDRMLPNLNLKFTGQSGTEYDNTWAALGIATNNADINALQDVITHLDKIITTLEKDNGYMLLDIQQNLIKNWIQNAGGSAWMSNLLATSPSAAAFYENFKEQIGSLAQQHGWVALPKTNKNASALSSRLNTITATKVFIEYIKHKLSTQTGGMAFNSLETSILGNITKSLASMLLSTAGFAAEDLAQLTGEKLINQFVKQTKNFNVSLGDVRQTGTSTVNYKYNPSSSNRNKTTSTQDIRYTINATDKTGSVTVNIPVGATSKIVSRIKGSPPAKTKGILHIKSANTTLQNLLHDIDNTSLSMIYNILANFGRTKMLSNIIEKEKIANPINKDIYGQLIEGFKIVAVVNSLLGQMTSSDLSYYLLLNGRVYSTVEVIRALLTGKGLNTIGGNSGEQFTVTLNMANTPTLSPTQAQLRKSNIFITTYANPGENAAERSQKAMAAILNAKIKAGVSLAFTKI